MSLNVSLQELMLLQQILDGRQIATVLLCSQVRLDLAQPEFYVLDPGIVDGLSVGLAELIALLPRLGGQVLPLVGECLDACGHGVVRVLALLVIDQALTGRDDLLEAVSVGRELRLEGLVLLVLGLTKRTTLK